MEQEHVVEHLKRIGELSETEQEKRDLYLRGLNNGEIQGPLTGNIYLDKPYSKWYRESLTNDFDPHNTLYTTFANSVVGRENEIAIVQPDIGKVMTYKELLDEVDKVAAGLSCQNIHEGSIVGMFFSNSIEEAIFLLAINKLGAISKWIDFTKDPVSLYRCVTETNLDMLVLENMLKPLEAMINPNHLPAVICNNEGLLLGHHITYNDLVNRGKCVKVTPAPFKEDRPAVIISSSGTTGEPKPITHSDFHLNFAARKMMRSNFPLDKDHIVMVTIPPHIGLGLITSLYTNLISGAKLAMIHCKSPEDSMNQTVGFLMNYRDIVTNLYQNPELRLVIFGAPIHVRIIASVEPLKDLSFLDGFLAAGSKIFANELEEFDKIYAAKGCHCPISNGYGQNEKAGAVAINDPVYNLNGAAGYPVIGSDVLVVNEQTGEILPPNVEGKILERCNSRFLYYYNLPEETENAFKEFNGVRYFDTKDLGYLNDEGFLFITGRTTRVIIKYDTKVALDEIEQKVRTLPFVKNCAAVVIDSGGSFEKLALFVEPVDGALDLTSDEFMNKVNDAQLLSEIEMPDKVVISSIPYMANSKVDYQELKTRAEGVTRERKID